MKQVLARLLRNSLHLTLFPLGLLLGQTLLAGVTFTVTPAVVSNTYNGTLTLQVAGLTGGDTVLVQKFLDVNANSTIDPGDPLVQQFNLTDGQAGMVIGGVTNFNVPGDLEAAAGQITATLQFNNADFIQHVTGKYLYKLSSPAGHFTPITDPFSITNFPYGQKITGQVVNSDTQTAVPHAVVLLFGAPRPGNHGPSSPHAAAVANDAGNFTFVAPPGTYVPMAFSAGYVANYATSPVLALSSGATITTNLALVAATASISGTVVDANDPSQGIPGVFVPAVANNGLLTVGFADSNGSFTIAAAAGQWSLQNDDTTYIVHGYVGRQDGTVVTAPTTGVKLTAPKATALFYGRVRDTLGNPMPGIDVYASDSNNNLYETDGYTDANGNYVAAVVGGLGDNDPWSLEISTDTSPTNYVFSQPGFDQYGGTNISAGTAVVADFTALLATNQISGHIQANGKNVAGLGVYAYATINGVDFNTYVDTDSSGNYSFNVGAGSWSVGVNCSGGDDSLDAILGSGNYTCPNDQSVTLSSTRPNATVNFTVQSCNGIQIFTTGLPDGQVGTYYNASLQGSSCDGTLNWSLNDPQDFPPGLGWSQNGQIQGTPNSSGTYQFSVTADDGNGHSATQTLSLTIAPASTPLQIITSYLPAATNGVFYSQTLQATGGQPPYNWSVPSFSAPLPPNLSLDTNGLISGTPATTADTYFFDVIVTDAASNTVEQDGLSLTLVNAPPPPLVITTTSLPAGNVGTPYSVQLSANGGQPPYNWSLALGSANLPPGLTLNSAGLISGTPTTNAVVTFKVQVTDAQFDSTSQVLSLSVNAGPVLTALGWQGNQLQMRLTGAPGVNYTLQMSTNLSAGNWTSLFTTNSPTSNSLILLDRNAADQQRFYRVQVGP